MADTTGIPKCGVSEVTSYSNWVQLAPLSREADVARQLGCLVEDLGRSLCAATNQTCLCDDPIYNQAVTSCVLANCTVVEQLCKFNSPGMWTIDLLTGISDAKYHLQHLRVEPAKPRYHPRRCQCHIFQPPNALLLATHAVPGPTSRTMGS